MFLSEIIFSYVSTGVFFLCLQKAYKVFYGDLADSWVSSSASLSLLDFWWHFFSVSIRKNQTWINMEIFRIWKTSFSVCVCLAHFKIAHLKIWGCVGLSGGLGIQLFLGEGPVSAIKRVRIQRFKSKYCWSMLMLFGDHDFQYCAWRNTEFYIRTMKCVWNRYLQCFLWY